MQRPPARRRTPQRHRPVVATHRQNLPSSLAWVVCEEEGLVRSGPTATVQQQHRFVLLPVVWEKKRLQKSYQCQFKYLYARFAVFSQVINSTCSCTSQSRLVFALQIRTGKPQPGDATPQPVSIKSAHIHRHTPPSKWRQYYYPCLKDSSRTWRGACAAAPGRSAARKRSRGGGSRTRTCRRGHRAAAAATAPLRPHGRATVSRWRAKNLKPDASKPGP